jgi:SAM-dependent methyltransferase
VTTINTAKPRRLGVLEYLIRRRTPVRELEDDAVARHIATLTGKVVELGALGAGRRSLAFAASEYLVTNIVTGAPVHLNASAMDLPDDSVDAFICESMLEHIQKPEQVLAEIRRVLRPGGKLLLSTPWMYPFHAAPGDYLRFSEPALLGLLEGFRLISLEPLGNFWTAMATFAQLKVRPWRQMAAPETALRLIAGSPLLGVGLGCYALSRVLREQDDFASMYFIVAEKPSS